MVALLLTEPRMVKRIREGSSEIKMKLTSQKASRENVWDYSSQVTVTDQQAIPDGVKLTGHKLRFRKEMGFYDGKK